MTRAALLARFTGGGEGIQGTVVTVFGGAPPARAVVGDSDRAAGAGDPQTCTPRAPGAPVRIVTVVGGARGRPLNTGIALA
jgi:hypothetical protein